MLSNILRICSAAAAKNSYERKRNIVKIFQRAKASMSNSNNNNVAATTLKNENGITAMTNIKPKPVRIKQQQQIKRKKTASFVPGIVNLQILGAGANGAPCSVYLFTDHSRYLFNCGEGTQRLAHEHKTRLSKLSQIFLTRNSWSMLGGFPGLALTVQDAGVRDLSVHGPPYVNDILQSMKRFVILKDLKVKTVNCTQMQHYEDDVMTVKSVPLYRQNGNEHTKENIVISYICTLKPRPGALNLEKCVEQGVEPGPLLGLLKNGIDVTLDNGTVVKSADVSEPAETALSFVFLDIPHEDFLPALQAQADIFTDMRMEMQQQVAVVVHFSTATILANEQYQNMMAKYFDAQQTQHLYLNSSSNNFSGYMAAHRIQYQLHQLNPKVFPLLNESWELCEGEADNAELKKAKLIVEQQQQQEQQQNADSMGALSSLCSFHLRPRKGFDRSLEAKLNVAEYINETHSLPNFTALLQQLRDTAPAQAAPLECSYPRILFLGTGSCVPNKTRNVSSILVETAANSYVLLDCGEGTLGQIIRFFGKAKATEIVQQQLTAIYVSHLHADHHIGLIALLNERRRGGTEKLLLFAPIQIEFWLNFYSEHIEAINEAYQLIGNAQMLSQPLRMCELRPSSGIASISTCLVRHCAHSFGISLLLQQNDVRVTYSGDTMPCQDLVELGRNSTILIHEATMEDDLLQEAEYKMHSTISQAIQQGRDMQAQHIVLTHFSQRYAKLPRMQQTEHADAAAATDMRNVCIAFDNMQLTLQDLQHFHLLYPALRALFAEHAEELEQKAMKRELKLERKRKLA